MLFSVLLPILLTLTHVCGFDSKIDVAMTVISGWISYKALFSLNVHSLSVIHDLMSNVIAQSYSLLPAIHDVTLYILTLLFNWNFARWLE